MDSHPTASEQRASCSVCPRAPCQALCGLCAQECGRGSWGARMQSHPSSAGLFDDSCSGSCSHRQGPWVSVLPPPFRILVLFNVRRFALTVAISWRLLVLSSSGATHSTLCVHVPRDPAAVEGCRVTVACPWSPTLLLPKLHSSHFWNLLLSSLFLGSLLD